MPAASQRDAKTERIVLKVSPTEKERADQRAQELGITTADLLRLGWRYFPKPKSEAA